MKKKFREGMKLHKLIQLGGKPKSYKGMKGEITPKRK